MVLVGVAGFEPATSASQTRRDNRATLHPDSPFAGANIIIFYKTPTNTIFFFAVRQGFEPWVPVSRYACLANKSFRPLRHLTIFLMNGVQIYII